MDRKKDENLNSSADFSIGDLGLSKLKKEAQVGNACNIVHNRDSGRL
jgi:hypothetical protein